MANEMMRIAGRSEAGLAKAIKTDDKGNVGVKPIGNLVNLSVAVETSMNPKGSVVSYNFITSKIEGSKSDAIKIAGYKYIDIIIVATEPHSFKMNESMYQAVLPEGDTSITYKSFSGDLGLYSDKYMGFVRDYKLDSNGGEAIFIKEMRVFGNYFNLSLKNNSDKLQNYLMLVNLYN